MIEESAPEFDPLIPAENDELGSCGPKPQGGASESVNSGVGKYPSYPVVGAG